MATIAVDDQAVSEDELSLADETEQDKANRLQRNVDRQHRWQPLPIELTRLGAVDALALDPPNQRRNRHPSSSRDLEGDFMMEFGGHQVYSTPKANLVVTHEEFNSVMETPQIAKLKAMVQAASVQLNQLDPALPV